MYIEESAMLRGFVRLCEDGWLQGWHERNGGNLTYRLTPEEADACRQDFSYDRPWNPIGTALPGLGGETFLTTGSGKYFRNVPLAPSENLCVVELNAAGDAWRMVWGMVSGGRPTSELPTHLMNHAVRVAATDGASRVIYHAHPANTVALTYVLPLNDRDFSRALWKSETECPIVFPRGVGVVPWMVPGGTEIAAASCEKMREYDAVIWAHHGMFVSGRDFDEAFGLMHTIEKAAQIFVLALSCGGVRQTIPDQGLLDVAHAFGVELRREFLDV